MESTQTDFKLKDIVVICRSCGLAFATSALVEIPPISDLDQVEADLHRVLPNADLRAALIAVCPDCHFASWTSTFTRVPLKVNVVPRSECPAAQKYALAVKTGRDNNMHPLDLAFIALNGCWAAREAGEPDDLWLELAAFEHARGLADNPLSAEEDGLGHLMMAEIWRQLRQFDRAIRHYDLALKDHSVPKDLITRQRMLAQNSHSAPTSLPAAMVREVFIAVSSPDVIYEEIEELPVPPMPAQKPNEKLAAILGVETSKPLTPPPVKRAATVSVTPAPQSPVTPSAPSAVPADRSAFVRESFPHTGNGQTGSSDDHDAYSDVLPAGKEHVVLPEAPAAAATAHNKVEARVHSHYFRRPSSPDAAAEPAADAWMSDYNTQQQPQPAAQPESFESDKWVAHTAAAMAAANNAQAVVPAPTEAEIEAFERYQNQVINTYVAAQASAVAVPIPVAPAPAPAVAPAAPAPMAPAASAGPAVVYSIEPTTLLPAYNDDEEEFDDEFEEDIPIEAIIPAITLTGDVNAAPLRKKKRRRRDRFAVSAPQALAPAVNYASPPAQPVHAPQQAYPAAMPAASYAMSGGGGGGNYAAPSETYEPPQPQYSQPQQPQYSQPQQQVSHQPHQQVSHQPHQQPVQQQPQVMDTDESGGAQMDVSDAVARVESYLALSQQARRINWLRGYRGN